MTRSKKDKESLEDIVFIEQPKTYKVEFISDLYSMSWRYKKGTIVELDEPTYIIAQKYNSIVDL
jgi:MinD-like ATPase involved in chromosome partitioning or flagellar assembly